MSVSPKGNYKNKSKVTPERKFIDTKVIVETKITDKIEYMDDGYDDDECMENLILQINCGICKTPVMTYTIDRDKYCLDGCPMEKIEELQKEQEVHHRHLQWIKEHGKIVTKKHNNTITSTKDTHENITKGKTSTKDTNNGNMDLKMNDLRLERDKLHNGTINEIKQAKFNKDQISGFIIQSYGLPQDEVTSKTGIGMETSTADTSSTWLANS